MKTWISVVIFGVLLTGCEMGEPKEPATRQASGPTAASKQPDENAAVAAIRKINEAQASHFKRNRRYALELDELVEARLLDSVPSPAQTGYAFNLRPAADAQTYKLSLVPSDATATSSRHFYTDQTGVIRAETGKDATAESPAVQ